MSDTDVNLRRDMNCQSCSLFSKCTAYANFLCIDDGIPMPPSKPFGSTNS